MRFDVSQYILVSLIALRYSITGVYCELLNPTESNQTPDGRDMHIEHTQLLGVHVATNFECLTSNDLFFFLSFLCVTQWC